MGSGNQHPAGKGRLASVGEPRRSGLARELAERVATHDRAPTIDVAGKRGSGFAGHDQIHAAARDPPRGDPGKAHRPALLVQSGHP